VVSARGRDRSWPLECAAGGPRQSARDAVVEGVSGQDAWMRPNCLSVSGNDLGCAAEWYRYLSGLA